MKSFLYLFFFGTLILNAQNNIRIIYQYNDYGEYERDLTLNIKDGLAQFVYHKNDTTLVNNEGMKFYHYDEHYENYFKLSTKKIIELRILKDNTPLISSWDADLIWHITDETKVINGYKAQKATTKSHSIGGTSNIEGYGDAIAWFTTDIPLGVGPERYYGLPGLIVLLEFELVKKKYFTLKEISYDIEIPKIKIPTAGIKVSKEQILEPWTISKKWLRKQKKNIAEEK